MGRIGPGPASLALAFAAGFAALWAQEATFSVDVKLVRLMVTVKDGDGKPVGSLVKQDFVVSDSGVPQTLTLFEHHTEQPLSVALLLDTSGSAAKDLKYSIDSASRFLRALTREGNPQDALALFTFNHDVTRQFGFTRNLDRFRDVSKRLKAEAGTSLYDAICFGAEALESRDGRKVIIAVTDGGDTTSFRDYHYTLRAAHKADALIYSIVLVPVENDAGRNTGGEHALIQFAQSTGGRAFFPTAGPALDRTFDEILRDLRTQYLIGYYPKALPPSKDRFRKVKVDLALPGLTASTRSGYYQD